MIHGDVVTLGLRHITVREKALVPVGIFPDSICWGQWISRGGAEQHLIVSPIHPTSWPFVLRLRLRLCSRVGSLLGAATVLSEQGLSVLFADCIKSGFGFAVWNVVAEPISGKSVAVRDSIESVLASVTGGDKDAAKRSWAMTEIGRVMSPYTKAVADAIHDANGSAQRPFLATPESFGGGYLIEEAGRSQAQVCGISQNDLTAFARAHQAPIVDVRWAASMAEFSLQAAHANWALKFRYNGSRHRLELYEPHSSTTIHDPVDDPELFTDWSNDPSCT